MRGIVGYTGTFDGRPVSVLASGMGIPSIGIYATELYRFYGVQRIIRIGTAGGMAPHLEVGDVVDSFGQESGRYLFPDGTPFDERGLPGYARTGAGGEELYHRFRVIHPFQVSATTAPAHEDLPGGGIRFTLDTAGFSEVPPAPTVRWLVGNGYLERIAVSDVPA